MHKLNVYSTTQCSISKCQISYGERRFSHMEGVQSTIQLSDVAFNYPPRTNKHNHHLSGDGLKAEFHSWCDYHEGERQGTEGHKKGPEGEKLMKCFRGINSLLPPSTFLSSSSRRFRFSRRESPMRDPLRNSQKLFEECFICPNKWSLYCVIEKSENLVIKCSHKCVSWP